MKEESSDDPKSSSDEKNRDEKDTKESAKVTIVGQPEAQWKAQFCIFDKLKQEGWFGQEEGRLTSQITIPRQGEIVSTDEIPVSITGNFFSNQSAQRKIRELVSREIQRQR